MLPQWFINNMDIIYHYIILICFVFVQIELHNIKKKIKRVEEELYDCQRLLIKEKVYDC